ncbi:MAG: helix-turn-helix domain-containing protein [Patescibacteria group bacterium]
MTRFYTVKETAQSLGFSTNTIYKYLATGRIKGTRGSTEQGRFRIPQSQLDSLLSDHQADANKDPALPLPVNGALPLLPIKIIRVLLIISLIFIVSELVLDRDFSLKGQIFRLIIVGIFIILSYQFTNFGQKRKEPIVQTS